ncbi:MAG: hypothetical protein Sapg2KO_30260 [Saprospiraceae bacterium]
MTTPLSILSWLLLLLSDQTWIIEAPTTNKVMFEICDNALDDDQDGLIDLNDPECACEILEPVSLIPNPSFEDLTCCPDNRSQLNCAEAWIQASDPTTDLIHNCGWGGWDEFPPPRPFPDGDGIMGFRDGRIRGNNAPDLNWKEYAGACLLSPLKAGNIYRFEFDLGFVSRTQSPPINITFFGTTDCANLPFGERNEDLGCPTNGPNWVRLASKLVSGSFSSWEKVLLEIEPQEDIYAIAIGPDCPPVNNPVSTYYFFDNLLLADFRVFELKIRSINHPCANDFTLEIGDNQQYTYQWYKDGIALVGETSALLSQIYGDGDYQVRIEDGESCRLSTTYQYQEPFITQTANVTICQEDFLPFGDRLLNEPGTYLDTLKSVENCDSIVSLNLKVLGALADTVQVQIFEGETYHIDRFRFRREGDHLITLDSDLGCDSLVLIQLEYFPIFIPSAFSPDGDGVNDRFSVFSENGWIESADFIIYDRWGAKVYEGPAWDGQMNGERLRPGVFVYVLNVTMNDGITRQFSGSVTLVR